jgi:predicted ArsR family transcriptional regulator
LSTPSIEVPVRIFTDRRLAPAARALYGVLRADPERTLDQAATELELNPAYLRRHERALIQHGYLGIREIRTADGCRRTYIFPGIDDADSSTIAS